MVERQYTRIDSVRRYLDDMLKQCEDKEVSRNGYVHLYGVGQMCALLALYRGFDRAYAELAEIAGMLHDYSKYKDNIGKEHGEKSSQEARKILLAIDAFSEKEIEMICQAISRHSDKGQIDTPFDEILKDADALQHWLRNPVEEYFYRKERTQKVAEEIGLNKAI